MRNKSAKSGRARCKIARADRIGALPAILFGTKVSATINAASQEFYWEDYQVSGPMMILVNSH
jgi:hypothetical protein